MQKKNKYILMCIIALIYVVGALTHTRAPWGESDDYMLPVISLSQHLSDDIRDSDIKLAYDYFPESSRYWDGWQNGDLPIFHESGKRYTWYFPTYSVAVMPFVYCAKWLGFSGSLGFPMANVFYWLFALLCLLKSSFMEERFKLLLFYALSVSPMLFYAHLPSAEMFIATLVLGSLTALYSRRYRLSMLLYALASTLNLTIAPFSIFIFFKWFTDHSNEKFDLRNYKAILLTNLKTIVQLLILNSIILIPVCINIIRWGRLAVMAGMGAHNGALERLVAYLLDLNFGILPYYPGLFIVIALCMFTKSRLEYFLFLLTVSIVFFGFSLMVHINCGMIGIARYLTWGVVFLIFGGIYYSTKIDNCRIKELVWILLVITTSLTMFISVAYGGARPNSKTQYTNMSPIARRVLDHAPWLYNPLFSTFNSRINHIDGGYNLPITPIFYFAKDGSVTKALVNEHNAAEANNCLVGDMRELSQLSKVNRLMYINFKPGTVWLVSKDN